MSISVKQNNSYATATGVWVKVNGVWKQVASEGLPGFGGWATIEKVEGTYTRPRYEYNDGPNGVGGTDWVAYEWTDDGKITTSGGLVDILMLGGAAANGAERANSGGLHHGLSVLPDGLSPVGVGVAGTSGTGNASGGKSVIGPYVAHGSGLAFSAANCVGVHGDKYAGSDPWGGPHLKGIDIDFLGTGVLPYGYALTTDRRANSGSSWDNAGAAAGVCIVRVPKAYADNVQETFHGWDSFALVTDGVVTEVTRVPDNEPHTLDAEWLPCPAEVQPGWDHTDGEFTPPPAPTREDLIAELQAQIKDLQKDK